MEVGEMHEDSVEREVSLGFALFRFVEEVEVVGESVVKVVGVEVVVGVGVSGPGKEIGDCGSVSGDCAGRVGCLVEEARLRHHETESQPD